MRSDVIVVGGGMVGAAIAYGLSRSGAKVRIIDEGDMAFRAARGNFGLTWVQTKGFGVQPYFELSRGSVDGWRALADELTERTGIDVDFERNGGLRICIGDKEAEERISYIERFRQQAGNAGYDCRFIDRGELQQLFPNAPLGPRVTGASFSPMDGHANPLYLLRSLIEGIRRNGGEVSPGQTVGQIRPLSQGFEVVTGSGTYSSDKIVLAAGLGTQKLGQMVGLNVPIRPQRGQVLVTERTHSLLPYPMSGLRQTAEGSIMVGVTNEEVGYDTTTSVGGIRKMAARAIETFPVVGELQLLRAWAALRILTPDGVPIYAESKVHPGAYAATCHSGVTLAAMHARLLPQWVLTGVQPAELAYFTPERFDAQPKA
ncbi:MAG: FAD-dependent oxidoreductase [Hyphomicrobiaceae bacterium]